MDKEETWKKVRLNKGYRVSCEIERLKRTPRNTVLYVSSYRKPMILRVAGLPATREDHARVSLVLRTTQHFDILGRVRD